MSKELAKECLLREIGNYEEIKSNTSKGHLEVIAPVSDIITELKKALKWVEQQEEWIDVELGLPNEWQAIIGCDEEGEVGFLYFDNYDNFKEFSTDTIIKRITHWRPLPQPPKTK